MRADSISGELLIMPLSIRIQANFIVIQGGPRVANRPRSSSPLRGSRSFNGESSLRGEMRLSRVNNFDVMAQWCTVAIGSASA